MLLAPKTTKHWQWDDDLEVSSSVFRGLSACRFLIVSSIILGLVAVLLTAAAARAAEASQAHTVVTTGADSRARRTARLDTGVATFSSELCVNGSPGFLRVPPPPSPGTRPPPGLPPASARAPLLTSRCSPQVYVPHNTRPHSHPSCHSVLAMLATAGVFDNSVLEGVNDDTRGELRLSPCVPEARSRC